MKKIMISLKDIEEKHTLDEDDISRLINLLEKEWADDDPLLPWGC